MKTIVFASQKGGSGKTTLAAHLAVAAEMAGDGPCVVIDTDPQASLADWWNVRESETLVRRWMPGRKKTVYDAGGSSLLRFFSAKDLTVKKGIDPATTRKAF